MNVHIKPDTLADRIRKVKLEQPELSSVEIGRMVGARPEYVRVVNQRRSSRTSEGMLTSALAIVHKTYADAIELRGQCELDSSNRNLADQYKRAWDLHRAAEHVYLGLLKSPADNKPLGVIREIDPRAIRGVSVRDALAMHAQSVPVVGSVR